MNILSRKYHNNRNVHLRSLNASLRRLLVLSLTGQWEKYLRWLYSDGRYQNFPLSIIAWLIATIMAIIAIPTAKSRDQKKEVSVLLQYTVSW